MTHIWPLSTPRLSARPPVPSSCLVSPLSFALSLSLARARSLSRTLSRSLSLSAHVGLCVRACVCVCVCIRMYVHTHTHTHTHTSVHMFIRVYVCLYVYVYICICICMSKHTWPPYVAVEGKAGFNVQMDYSENLCNAIGPFLRSVDAFEPLTHTSVHLPHHTH